VDISTSSTEMDLLLVYTVVPMGNDFLPHFRRCF
jgi:hypothetical protein